MARFDNLADAYIHLTLSLKSVSHLAFSFLVNHNARVVTPNDNLVTAYIPGLINKILVKEGQKVKKGEQILTFEAMKMNNRVYSNKNAKIKRLFVKIGDLFPRGTILAELEPID